MSAFKLVGNLLVLIWECSLQDYLQDSGLVAHDRLLGATGHGSLYNSTSGSKTKQYKQITSDTMVSATQRLVGHCNV